LGDLVIVVDEFDSILFNSQRNILEIITLFKSFPAVFGITGSDFRDYHSKLIESSIDGTVVKIRGPSLSR